MWKEARILRDVLLIVAAALMAACATPATARAGHGGQPAAVTGPVLASVQNTFGNKSIAGYGEERLSRQDQNYGAKYSPYGTGILVSGSCAKWSTAVLSGNAGYWNTISHVAEGAGAVTPNLTATGVTNSAGGAGTTTTFTVNCEDASNNVLATSVLTYLIDDGDNHCGAVSIGDQDNTGAQYWPTGFASTIDGCKILMSTGYVKTARFGIGMPFAHTVSLTFADPSRPGELANLETNSNSTHARIDNVMVLTSATNCVGCSAAFVLGGTNTSADNIHAYATSAMRAVGSHSCILTNGTTTSRGSASVTHFGCEWYSGFFTPRTNYLYQYFWSRYVAADAMIIANYQHDVQLLDGIVMAMKQPVANHPDCLQIGDGATFWDSDVKRIICAQLGGTVGAQGIQFGGGPSGVGNIWKGFITDTACSGSAGQTLCNVTGGAQSNADASKIYSDGGSPLTVADGVTVNCGGTPCPFNAAFIATGSGTNLTVSSMTSSNSIVIGSMIYGAGVAWGTTIVSQTSIDPGKTAGHEGVYVTSAATTGTASTVNTITKYPLVGLSGNINYGSLGSPAQFYGAVNVRVNFDMILNAGYVIQGMFPSGNGGTGTITHVTDTLETVVGQSSTGPPRLRFVNCQTLNLWQAGLTVSKGSEFSQWDSDCAVGTNPPAGTTVTDVISAGQNPTTLASFYLNGNPQTCIEAPSIATYDAMSVQAAMVYGASCVIAKSGGPLDLGSGQVANAFGTSSTPTWADGTVVGTGFAGQ